MVALVLRMLVFGCWCWGCLAGAWAQVTFVVTDWPASTPEEAPLYLTGTFNGWAPGDSAYALQRQPDGSYQLTLDSLTGPFAYKFTRGTWQTTEADPQGRPIPNRRWEAEAVPTRLTVQIEGWEDRAPQALHDSITLRVTRIPRSTPHDAALYVTGNFNGWVTDDETYRLSLQADSSFAVKVPASEDTLEYKLTRGDWSSVEGRASGRARFNRQLVLSEWDGNPVRIDIASWEDISGTPVNAYTIFWLMAAIQGVLIIVAINSLDRNNLPANRLLTVLLLIISAALISRVVIYDRDIFNFAPKLLLVPDLLYFLYPPMFMFYIRRLLRPSPRAIDYRELLHLLPFGLHALAYLPLFLMDHQAFINQAVGLALRPYFVWAAGLALPYALGYWLYARRLIRIYQHESDHKYSAGSNLGFLQQVMTLKGICLVLWVATFAVGAYGRAMGIDTTLITDRTTDAIWIGFSLTVFLLGYYAMKEPEIFRIPHTDSPEAERSPLGQEDAPSLRSHGAPHGDGDPDPESTPEADEPQDLFFDEALKDRLESLMAEEQPYLNPKLTLSELADLAHTNPHELSRAINQGFGMNFNDFVNSYRVEAFKQRVVEPRYQNHTFLAVAMMVGFNSKTAFNRSFKKLTGETPREYFKAKVEG